MRYFSKQDRLVTQEDDEREMAESQYSFPGPTQMWGHFTQSPSPSRASRKRETQDAESPLSRKPASHTANTPICSAARRADPPIEGCAACEPTLICSAASRVATIGSQANVEPPAQTPRRGVSGGSRSRSRSGERSPSRSSCDSPFPGPTQMWGGALQDTPVSTPVKGSPSRRTRGGSVSRGSDRRCSISPTLSFHLPSPEIHAIAMRGHEAV